MSQVTDLLEGEEFEGEAQLVGIGAVAIPELTQILNDPNQRALIRSRAAIVLGRVDAVDATDDLLGVVDSPVPASLMCFAAAALAEMPSIDRSADYRSRLQHSEICVREAMARALGSVAETREDLDALLDIALTEESRLALAAQRQAVLSIQSRGLAGQIAGTVSSSATGGLAGVTVTLSSGMNTTTAADGSYRFTGLSADSFTVSISGFDPTLIFPDTNQDVTLGEGEVATVDFTAP